MASKTLISQTKNFLPPLILYRQILRIHRLLPPSLRSLGDDYVKAEFRRHKDVTNPIQIVGFIDQWQFYLDKLKIQVNTAKLQPANKIYGKKFDSNILEKFSEQQLGQLYVLRNEIKDNGKSKVRSEEMDNNINDIENLAEKKTKLNHP
ncbi:ACN9-domain-containing protein [Rhizophagus clarus]|uniref:Succinate dehydrogenase assembly factor 3 n=1 Tax=Rhizophagus clarus TaxID=94130 RepID=A0A8H3QTW3_9GLOM|nr:ACN9-domain-containing protein [Rhizophagus clarus]